MNAIKAGRAHLPMQSFDVTDVEQAKKLAVVEITPYYFDDDIFKPLDFMYPYADLKIEADFGNSKTATFYLQCPILSANRSEP